MFIKLNETEILNTQHLVHAEYLPAQPEREEIVTEEYLDFGTRIGEVDRKTKTIRLRATPSRLELITSEMQVGESTQAESVMRTIRGEDADRVWKRLCNLCR